ncbi:MAG: hypothetical protein AAGA03_14330, partial [Planctomycetota bacterium]
MATEHASATQPLSGSPLGSPADSQATQSFQGPMAAPASMLWGMLGAVVAGGFLGLAAVSPIAALQRYFLGHPVAMAATFLFGIAAAILLGKWLQISGQLRRLNRIRDVDLSPPLPPQDARGRFRLRHDAGMAATHWLQTLSQLPSATRESWLCRRLDELL